MRRLYVAMVRPTHKALELIALEDGAQLSAEEVRGAVLASVGAALAQIGEIAEIGEIGRDTPSRRLRVALRHG